MIGLYHLPLITGRKCSRFHEGSSPSSPNIIKRDKMLNERQYDNFFAKVVRGESTDACWVWTGSKSSKGYGNFNVNRSTQSSHRISYRLHVGEIGEGLIICHTCDNPACVNPDHLFTGTHLDNVTDKMDKGRDRYGNQKGIANASSRLSEEDVRYIVTLLPSMTNVAISKLIGKVTHASVSLIRRGKSWSHITGITSTSHPKYESLQVNKH